MTKKILNIIKNEFLTVSEIANQLDISISEVNNLIIKLRNSNNSNIIASRPGPRGYGGYKCISSKTEEHYIDLCRCWVRNWRMSKNITPKNSPILESHFPSNK